MYSKKRLTGEQLAENYFRELDKQIAERMKEKNRPEIFPTISFSRKIGVGALEIADMVAKEIRYQVIDREILEHIAAEAKLTEKTVALYDERYAGKTDDFINLMFGEKSFIKSDYNRHLFSAILSFAGLNPTVFVGRGTHLILPRDRVMSVRCICSDEHRIKRISSLLKITGNEAEKKLEQADKAQEAFFQKTFKKKNADVYEFDLVINCDYFDVTACAKIVLQAFREKFKEEIKAK